MRNDYEPLDPQFHTASTTPEPLERNELHLSDQPLNILEQMEIDDFLIGHGKRRRIDWLRISAVTIVIAVLLSFLVAFVVHVNKSGSLAEQARCMFGKNKLLLLSIDGFAFKYLQSHQLPAFQKLQKSGSMASQGMLASFPTKTFPNHVSIMTGLLPESHGIVSNDFYDPVFAETFDYTKPQFSSNGTWFSETGYTGQNRHRVNPIWNAVHSVDKKSAILFWPGSEAAINGDRPNYYVPYSEYKNYNPLKSVQRMVDLLSGNYYFVAGYFGEVDYMGHVHGTPSKEVAKALEDVDNALQFLFHALSDRGLDGKVNVLVVSDHGFVDLDPQKYHVDISQYLDLTKVRVIEANPIISIWPNDLNETDSIFNQLKNVNSRYLKFFKREQVPLRYRFSQNRRIAPIVGIPQSPNVIKFRKEDDLTKWSKGTHGYDHMDPDMRSIFFGYGPDFKAGFGIPELFSNTDLYNLMNCLLGIENVSSNDGTAEGTKALKSALKI